MWDKSVPSVTIKLYPLTLAGVILLSSLTLGSWGLWWFQVYPPGWRTGSGSTSDLQPSFAIPDPLSSPSDPLVWSEPVLQDAGVSLNPTSAPVANPTPDVRQTGVSVLRVGNQTSHPVRIALLQRFQVDAVKDAPVTNFPLKELKEPVHWDFEPGEGGYQGLILSLPQGDLQLEQGDVLMAFAQDGSRRYWGPYVVGETSLPYWNGERSEWQLLLQP